jgi:nitroimidazol reductase NimA-like FMN-containing flavoprotein (pyridoxamine 5'-phosphate oxidase superfamily)
MEEDEIEELLQEQVLCRIAFRGDRYPYIAPFQYVYIDGTLYFHFTDYGKKKRLLEKDNRVCVEIEKYQDDLSDYSFVALRGRLKIVTDSRERKNALIRMAEKGEEKLSENFLAAHGFERGSGWSSLNPEKSLIIVKLEEISEVVGLKSP